MTNNNFRKSSCFQSEYLQFHLNFDNNSVTMFINFSMHKICIILKCPSKLPSIHKSL